MSDYDFTTLYKTTNLVVIKKTKKTGDGKMELKNYKLKIENGCGPIEMELVEKSTQISLGVFEYPKQKSNFSIFDLEDDEFSYKKSQIVKGGKSVQEYEIWITFPKSQIQFEIEWEDFQINQYWNADEWGEFIFKTKNDNETWDYLGLTDQIQKLTFGF
jgi:hypothetical protein